MDLAGSWLDRTQPLLAASSLSIAVATMAIEYYQYELHYIGIKPTLYLGVPLSILGSISIGGKIIHWGPCWLLNSYAAIPPVPGLPYPPGC